MVEQNRINLVEELTKNQKNNLQIILTTFCFDPVFFDNFLLKKLEQNNPNADLVVLVDASQYKKSLDQFTSLTGTKYQLVPVYLEKGFFHPKLFIFLSDEKLTLYIGSANLTLQGLTNNAELISKIECYLNEKNTFFKEINPILSNIIEKGLVRDDSVIQVFDEVKEKLLQDELFGGEDSSIKIFHNLQSPILPQIMSEIKNWEFEELFVLAPFLSKQPKLFIETFKHITPKKVILGLQRGNNNLEEIDNYCDLMKQKNISFDVKEASFLEEGSNRPFHSKIFFFKGINPCFFVGSPNFTEYAMLNTVENGNFECGVLYKGVSFDEILNSINLVKTQDINSLLSPKRPDELDKSAESNLRIYSVNYDDFSKKLSVKTEKIPNEAKYILEFESGEKIEENTNLKDGIFEIPNLTQTPRKITIDCGNKSFTRSIFYDKNRFFKKLFTTSVSIEEITQQLEQVPSFDTGLVESLLVSLSKKMQGQLITKTKTNNTKQIKKDKPKLSHPSRVKSFPKIGWLRNLEIISNYLSIKNSEPDQLEETFPEKLTKQEIKTKQNRVLQPRDFEKISKRFLNNLDEFLQKCAEEFETKNKDSGLLNYQILFIKTFWTHFKTITPDKKEIDCEILENFLEKLDKDLESIDSANCSEEELLKMFKWAVAFNYYYNYNYAERPYIDRNLIPSPLIINKNTYIQTKKFTQETLYQALSARKFNEEEFIKHYSVIANFCPGNKIKLISKSIENEKNEDTLKMYRKTIELISRDHPYSVSPEEKRDLSELLKTLDKKLQN